MSKLVKNIINRDIKLNDLYKNNLTPTNINDIIVFISDFKFSKKNNDLNIQDSICDMIKYKIEKLTKVEKDNFIQLLMQKSLEVKESKVSINILTTKNREIPFYQSIKLRFPKLINLFIEYGYNPNEKEIQYILDKGLYYKINTELLDNLIEVPNSQTVFLSLKKELSKFHNKGSIRNLEVIENLFNTKNKEEILNFLEMERSQDILIPYFYNDNNSITKNPSTAMKCIISKDLSGIYSLLKNDFILNLKEYSLMYRPLLIDQEDFQQEINFIDFYNIREYIIKKLNTYPQEYKKELTLNILREVELNNKKDPDIIFSLKDVFFDSFSYFNEREKFEFIKIKQNLIAPVFVAMLSKEDQEFFLNIFGCLEKDFPRIFLKNIYPLTKNSSLYKEGYLKLFYDKLKKLSQEEKQNVINVILAGKSNESEERIKNNLELVAIIEKKLLKPNIVNMPEKNHIIKRL